MQASHILRKYEPAQWGGTETAVQRLIQGLQQHGISSTVHAPHCVNPGDTDPLRDAGAKIQRYRAFVPVVGISAEQREALISWGGNLFSFELFFSSRGIFFRLSSKLKKLISPFSLFRKLQNKNKTQPHRAQGRLRRRLPAVLHGPPFPDADRQRAADPAPRRRRQAAREGRRAGRQEVCPRRRARWRWRWRRRCHVDDRGRRRRAAGLEKREERGG